MSSGRLLRWGGAHNVSLYQSADWNAFGKIKRTQYVSSASCCRVYFVKTTGEVHLQLRSSSSTKEWGERVHYFDANSERWTCVCVCVDASGAVLYVFCESHDSVFVTQRQSSLVITTLCSYVLTSPRPLDLRRKYGNSLDKNRFLCPVSPSTARILFLFKSCFFRIVHPQCTMWQFAVRLAGIAPL